MTDANPLDTATLLQAIIESPQQIVIFALDRNYRYLAFNTNHKATMQAIWQETIALGTNMLDVIKSPEDREKAKINFDRALTGERFTLIEAYGNEGSRFYYENTYNPIVGADGTVIGLTVFLSDVTVRVNTENELRESRRQLEALAQQRADDLETMGERLRVESEQRQQMESERLELQQEIIDTQQAMLRELSTPLIPLADEVVAMPLVGRIDNSRAVQIMEILLEGIAKYQAEVAILDISGVRVIDTQVANALLQAARAAQLLGTRVVLTGISQEVAQTVVHLGADLSGIVTLANLQDGMRWALSEGRDILPR